MKKHLVDCRDTRATVESVNRRPPRSRVRSGTQTPADAAVERVKRHPDGCEEPEEAHRSQRPERVTRRLRAQVAAMNRVEELLQYIDKAPLDPQAKTQVKQKVCELER